MGVTNPPIGAGMIAGANPQPGAPVLGFDPSGAATSLFGVSAGPSPITPLALNLSATWAANTANNASSPQDIGKIMPGFIMGSTANGGGFIQPAGPTIGPSVPALEFNRALQQTPGGFNWNLQYGGAPIPQGHALFEAGGRIVQMVGQYAAQHRHLSGNGFTDYTYVPPMPPIIPTAPTVQQTGSYLTTAPSANVVPSANVPMTPPAPLVPGLFGLTQPDGNVTQAHLDFWARQMVKHFDNQWPIVTMGQQPGIAGFESLTQPIEYSRIGLNSGMIRPSGSDAGLAFSFKNNHTTMLLNELSLSPGSEQWQAAASAVTRVGSAMNKHKDFPMFPSELGTPLASPLPQVVPSQLPQSASPQTPQSIQPQAVPKKSWFPEFNFFGKPKK